VGDTEYDMSWTGIGEAHTNAGTLLAGPTVIYS